MISRHKAYAMLVHHLLYATCKEQLQTVGRSYRERRPMPRTGTADMIKCIIHIPVTAAASYPEWLKGKLDFEYIPNCLIASKSKYQNNKEVELSTPVPIGH